METLVVWLAFAVVIAVIAHQRGRRGWLWFLLAACFSPVIVGVILLVMPNMARQTDIETPAP